MLTFIKIDVIITPRFPLSGNVSHKNSHTYLEAIVRKELCNVNK